MRRRPLAALLAVAIAVPAFLAVAGPAAAQGPAARWRTAETPHFRVHYPLASEAWALRAAGKLEAIRAAVVSVVGYEPPQTVDVFVGDPVAEANGLALPFLGTPRLVLWTSSPPASSVIGHYRDWIELLSLHEETHLVHLLRPSRNPARRALGRLLPFGPLALSSPRWVSEGYATLVEGRLSGAGRPNGDLRAAILRRWALAGKLPGYERLASDSDGYLGSSMAYLAGSAYLEWLEERAGPESLKRLWARMSAREVRSFDSSFEGVFGGSPRDLWDRYRAELSARSLDFERRLSPAREGELWQELSRSTGEPALSPNGDRLALVLDRKKEPAELVVWSTAPDTEAETKDAERRARIAALDPEDIPAVRTKPLARKPLFRLPAEGGRAPVSPRFLPGGDAILFVRFEPDGEGFLHPDLFSWTLSTGAVRRITRGADVRDPDPAPDGTWAVAVRDRDGLSQLVRVDLASGATADLTPPSLDAIADHPRISPDGGRLVYARHVSGAWRLAVRELRAPDGAERELAMPEGALPSAPAWSADGTTVFASLGREGRIDVAAFPVAGDSPPSFVTATLGAAFAPSPTPDGRALFFLSLEPHGLDLRRIDLGADLPPEASLAGSGPDPFPSLAPLVRPELSPDPPSFAAAPVAPGRPYGLGRLEIQPLAGGASSSAGGGAFELGVRAGDPLGRLEILAFAGSSPSGPTGGALSGSFRGLPVALGIRLFDLRERPSEQKAPPRGLATDLDLARRGFELSAAWERRFGALRTDVVGRAARERIEPRGEPDGEDLDRSLDRWTAGGEIWLAADLSRGKKRLAPAAALRADAGATGGDRFHRIGGEIGIAAGRGKNDLRLAWRRDEAHGVRRAFDLFAVGGVANSLAPASFARIAAPALAAGALVGARHEGQRAEIAHASWPLIFFERHRTGGERGPLGPWLSFAGLEETLHLDRLPIARLPALDLRAGIAQILDAPDRGARRAWLSLVWRP